MLCRQQADWVVPPKPATRYREVEAPPGSLEAFSPSCARSPRRPTHRRCRVWRPRDSRPEWACTTSGFPTGRQSCRGSSCLEDHRRPSTGRARTPSDPAVAPRITPDPSVTDSLWQGAPRPKEGPSRIVIRAQLPARPRSRGRSAASRPRVPDQVGRRVPESGGSPRSPVRLAGDRGGRSSTTGSAPRRSSGGSA